MANEYLKRTPTSTGNRKVWTLSAWIKRSDVDNTQYIFFADRGSNTEGSVMGFSNAERIHYYQWNGSSYDYRKTTNAQIRDPGSWIHYLFTFDSTKPDEDQRQNIFVNGVKYNSLISTDAVTINFEGFVNSITEHSIGRNADDIEGVAADFFFVDGQALTPDVFGFYKDGNGYISAGSTQATDFRPGQWVPKTPRVIKAQIERNGGFGVNGFYLPMNDSSNFGADFHTTPNSIITLKGEDLPQPRNGAPETTDSYVSQLREDPYADNLVLAVPGIVGGASTGYGDYSADIKGSGSNKTVTANGNAGVAVTASYYGSALSFDGTGDYFTVPNTADLRMGSDDFTIEAWVNKNDTNNGAIFGLYDNGNDRRSYLLYTDGSNDLTCIVNNDGTSGTNTMLGGSSSTNVGTNQWNHCALEREGSYLRLYLNGVVAGIATDLSGSLYENTDDTPAIGAWFNSGVVTGDVSGYIQDLRIYKGVAKYKGGFDVPKPYTPVGIGTWRAVPDTTANNFATLNPLANAVAATLTNGNLQAQGTAANDKHVFSTFGFTSGKWYTEVYDVDQQARGQIIVSDADHNVTTTGTNNVGVLLHNGTVFTSGTDNGDLSAFSTGDILSIAYDADIGSVWLAKNGAVDTTGAAIATNISTTPERDYRFSYREAGGTQTTVNWNFGQNPTFSGNTTAGTYTDSNGKGLFKYEPPSGFLALCEDNLPTPAIKNPGEYFKTVLYTGSGSVRSIVGVGFTPDLVWIKERTSTSSHHLFDSVRGPGLNLLSNSTAAEAASSTQLYSFDSDGFSNGTSGGTNESGQTYVAWCWRAGAGTTSTNTDGTISSVVSVNQDAGFSIVSYTATGSTGSIGHGLGKTPAFVITKHRNLATHWRIWHKGLSGYNYTLFFTTGAEQVQPAYSALPTDSVINLANDLTGSYNFVTYCWAEIEGFSKAFSYVGNGNANGPMIWLGLKPAFVILKRTDGTGNWVMHDNARNSTNPAKGYLLANSSGVEQAGNDILDFLSNGFKIRNSWTDINASGGTYIGMAFAESPFVYSNSK